MGVLETLLLTAQLIAEMESNNKNSPCWVLARLRSQETLSLDLTWQNDRTKGSAGWGGKKIQCAMVHQGIVKLTSSPIKKSWLSWKSSEQMNWCTVTGRSLCARNDSRHSASIVWFNSLYISMFHERKLMSKVFEGPAKDSPAVSTEMNLTTRQ